MAAGAYIFGCEGPVLSDRETAFFREADPWGFILFARNVETPDQLRRLTSDLRASVGREAPVLVDQEGGRVARLRAPHWREWLPPLDEMAEGGAEALRSRYRTIGAELRAVGIDVNCVPDADIARADTHPFLRNRCYGEDPLTVTRASRAVADGLLEGGALPIMKHMPGHGRSELDTHHELPRVKAPKATLMAEDFAPFRALADLPMGMTGHLVFEAIDPDRPATQSPDVIRLIRDELGFDGLLMTDDISMEALSGTVAERGKEALGAGVDLVLHCNGDVQEMTSVAETAGRQSETTANRADRALALRPERGFAYA